MIPIFLINIKERWFYVINFNQDFTIMIFIELANLSMFYEKLLKKKLIFLKRFRLNRLWDKITLKFLGFLRFLDKYPSFSNSKKLIWYVALWIIEKTIFFSMLLISQHLDREFNQTIIQIVIGICNVISTFLSIKNHFENNKKTLKTKINSYQ